MNCHRLRQEGLLYNKMPQTRWIKQHTFILTVLESGKLEIKVLVDFVSTR